MHTERAEQLGLHRLVPELAVCHPQSQVVANLLHAAVLDAVEDTAVHFCLLLARNLVRPTAALSALAYLILVPRLDYTYLIEAWAGKLRSWSWFWNSVVLVR